MWELVHTPTPTMSLVKMNPAGLCPTYIHSSNKCKIAGISWCIDPAGDQETQQRKTVKRSLVVYKAIGHQRTFKLFDFVRIYWTVIYDNQHKITFRSLENTVDRMRRFGCRGKSENGSPILLTDDWRGYLHDTMKKAQKFPESNLPNFNILQSKAIHYI